MARSEGSWRMTCRFSRPHIATPYNMRPNATAVAAHNPMSHPGVFLAAS